MGKNYVSADNRRLWILKELESLGCIEEVIVKHVKDIYRGKSARTSRIKIRGNGPGGDEITRLSLNLSEII